MLTLRYYYLHDLPTLLPCPPGLLHAVQGRHRWVTGILQGPPLSPYLRLTSYSSPSSLPLLSSHQPQRRPWAALFVFIFLTLVLLLPLSDFPDFRVIYLILFSVRAHSPPHFVLFSYFFFLCPYPTIQFFFPFQGQCAVVCFLITFPIYVSFRLP